LQVCHDSSCYRSVRKAWQCRCSCWGCGHAAALPATALRGWHTSIYVFTSHFQYCCCVIIFHSESIIVCCAAQPALPGAQTGAAAERGTCLTKFLTPTTTPNCFLAAPHSEVDKHERGLAGLLRPMVYGTVRCCCGSNGAGPTPQARSSILLCDKIADGPHHPFN
jgi:hypothetical protein